MAKFPVIN